MIAIMETNNAEYTMLATALNLYQIINELVRDKTVKFGSFFGWVFFVLVFCIQYTVQTFFDGEASSATAYCGLEAGQYSAIGILLRITITGQ